MNSKKWALIAVLSVVAVFVLAACAPAASTATEAGGATEAASTGKDTLIICQGQEPDNLYIPTSTMAVTVQVFHAMSGLGWYYDNAFFYGTRMLEKFPSFDDGSATLENNVLSVTYTFKEGITWSDGTPFTVDDIIFTRDVILDPDSGVSSRGILDQLTFEKVDDRTLKVTYPEGVKDPLYFLPPLSSPTATGGDILPKHVLEGTAPADIATSDYARGVGPVLGPYQFSEWEAGDHITLTAVENWWGGEAKAKTLIFRIMPDSNQVMASLLAGECDYGTSDVLSVAQLPFIQQSGEKGLLNYTASPGTVWEHVNFNTWPLAEGTDNNGTPFFADVRVRQAVGFGTNRQQMTDEILYGAVTPLDSFLPSDHWAFNPDTAKYPYDPDKAKALLAEAGWADGDGDGVVESSQALSGDYSCGRGSWSIPAGTPFEVTLTIPATPSFRGQISTVFQSNMADIGIKVNINAQAAGVVFADDGPLYHRTYQLVEFAWVAGPDPTNIAQFGGMNVYSWDSAVFADLQAGPSGNFLVAEKILAQKPDILAGTSISEEDFKFGRPEGLPEGLTLLYVEQIPEAKDTYEGGNDVGYCNPDTTQALFDGDNVIDPAERTPFFQEAQKLFMEDLPILPMFQRVEVEAGVKTLCGPDLGPANYSTWNVETWYFDETGACGQ